MHKVPAWKPILLLAIIALSAWSLYPPEKRLKPGLDLVGGTTLIYEVQTEEGIANRKQVLEDTIEVLRKRVDPAGVRNLIWRVQGTNRIEIQMALPPKQTSTLRQAFIEARDKLIKGNISEHRLDAAIKADAAQRDAMLNAMAPEGSPLHGQLTELAAAHDAMIAAREPYDTAQKQVREAEATLQALPEDATKEQKDEVQEHINALLAQSEPLTRDYVIAKRKVSEARKQVLATNIDETRLESILATYDPDANKLKAREAYNSAIKALTEKDPQRADEINEVAKAYEAYAAVKGPLDDPNDLIAMLRGSGVLEFRIAAPGTLPDAGEYRDQLRQRGPRAGGDKPWRWFVIDNPERFGGDAKDYARLIADPDAYFTGRGMVGTEYAGNYYLLLGNRKDSAIRREDGNWALTQVYQSRDELGFSAIGFALNTVGGQLMGNLTASHTQQPMAILLDGRILSAPNINERIADSGIITGGQGGFSTKEMQYMLNTMGAGSTQAQLSQTPVSVKTTGPQLGQDNLRHGLEAAIWSLILIGGFMLVYYFFWGAVANFVLIANLLIVLAVMAMLEATFTLPGIAGLVLTIGMAVDANVLIFERIREEMERKADLHTAVRLGYDKAMSTIIDSNLTTLITCLILGYTASADVKGFAVTLGIGLVANVLTAVIFSRWIVDLYIQWFKPKSLSMLALVSPAVRRLLSPNIDWVGKRYVFIGISAVLMVASVAAIVMRGADFFDIEFRSGTQVTIELSEGKTLSLEDARQRLTKVAEATNLAELSGQRAQVVTIGPVSNGQATSFSIATLETDVQRVSDLVKEGFSDVLDIRRAVTFAGIRGDVAQASVYAVRHAALGENINDQHAQDVSDYVGGVALVLRDMTPAITASDLEQRIQRLRLQSPYDQLGSRQFEVIGLEESAGGPGADAQPTYRSAVVLVRDGAYNYADSPEMLRDAGGLTDTEWELVSEALGRDTSLAGVSNFSSQVSRTMQHQAIAAIVLSWLAIMAYVWIRFGGFVYGLGAIIALIHDVVVSVGLAAMAFWVYDTWVGQSLLLTAFRIDLAMVAAVLTLIGYSVNDTIVIYDRIRENRGRLAIATAGIINDSINQTISRTILTAGTTMVAILLLYVLGGPGVHGFAFVMLIGSVVGCYSTIGIASPLLLVLARHVAKSEGVKASASSAA